MHCQWEDQVTRERDGHLPSYAEAKKDEVADTSYEWLHLGTSLRGCSSSSSTSFFFNALAGLVLEPPYQHCQILAAGSVQLLKRYSPSLQEDVFRYLCYRSCLLQFLRNKPTGGG